MAISFAPETDHLARRRFDKSANDMYMYDDAAKLPEDTEELLRMVNDHQHYQRPRLDELDDYYKGDNVAILKPANRRKEPDHADHRATHNYARYVSQFIQGYLMGNGVTVQHENGRAQETLDELNEINEANALNSELVLDLSIYGRAYELLYRNENDEVRFVVLSPLTAFVIYDDTVEQKPIAAVRYRNVRRDNQRILKVTLYTMNEIIEYEQLSTSKLQEVEDGRTQHFFQGVPINEYMNNRQRQGDYENVLNLIDRYDASQSDIANYMTDLNDAMLAITGDVEMDVETARQMKEANLVLVKPPSTTEGSPGSVDVKYIYKQYDVEGVESYKRRLQNDIHKYTFTPDLNDENFSGVQSGESMKYKLFGLEQIRSIKERLFRKGIRNRYRLCGNIMKTAEEASDDLGNIELQFKPNLPTTIAEQIEAFTSLGGELPEELILTLIPSLVEDPQKVIEMLEKERSDQEESYPQEDFSTLSVSASNESEGDEE